MPDKFYSCTKVALSSMTKITDFEPYLYNKDVVCVCPYCNKRVETSHHDTFGDISYCCTACAWRVWFRVDFLLAKDMKQYFFRFVEYRRTILDVWWFQDKQLYTLTEMLNEIILDARLTKARNDKTNSQQIV